MLLFHSMNAGSVVGIPCFMQKLSVLTGGRDAILWMRVLMSRPPGETFTDCFDK